LICDKEAALRRAATGKGLDEGPREITDVRLPAPRAGPACRNLGAGGGTVQATNAIRRYLTNRVGAVVLIDIKQHVGIGAMVEWAPPVWSEGGVSNSSSPR
jgi:hypothetical protein